MSDTVGSTGVTGVSASERGVGEMPDKRGAEALSRDKTDARTKNSRNNHVEGEDGRCSRAMRGKGVYRNSIFAIHSLFLSFGVRIFFRQLIFGDLSRICDSQGVKIRI